MARYRCTAYIGLELQPMKQRLRTLGLLLTCLFGCDAGDGTTDPEHNPGGGKADSAEPACCDPDDEPLSIDGAHCCADGSWALDIGNGDPAVCDPAGGLGEVREAPAQCCDPEAEPVIVD